jgi:hypothetical protein
MKATFALVGLVLLVLLPAATSLAQQEQELPIIVYFESSLKSIPLADLEAGTQKTTLAWQTLNLTEGYQLRLYAYEIATWVDLLADRTEPLPASGSLEIPVRHPLNFNPPTYRLLVMDAALQVYSETIISIPITASSSQVQPLSTPTASQTPLAPLATQPQPVIARFTVEQSTLEANKLAYENALVNVSWEVTDRTPTSNLVFEQVLPDGEAISVELSRRNLWVSSLGSGAVKPVYPQSGNVVALRLRLIDVRSGETLDEAGQNIQITGTLSTPTPPPPSQPRPTQPSGGEVANVVPPVASAGTSGGFELGGHIASFGSLDIARSAGMNWVKQQLRWRRGEGTGAAAGIISSAHSNGFKVLLGIVGYRDDMGDFEGYTNDFAAYLGQVAALGPDAIEVWNEPNIDREWPAGTINGANYTAMLAKSFNAIKAANANVMVISGAPAPTGFFGGTCTNAGCDDNVFLRQMASAGAAQYMDCVGAHYNEGIISPDQNSGDPRGGHYSRYFTAMLNLYFNTFGGSRKVCWTELGFLTPEGYSPLPGAFAWAQNTTLAQQAEWLGLAARRSRESGRVRLMIVWNVDFTVYDADPQAGYAIRRADGSCPACATLAAAMQ